MIFPWRKIKNASVSLKSIALVPIQRDSMAGTNDKWCTFKLGFLSILLSAHFLRILNFPVFLSLAA